MKTAEEVHTLILEKDHEHYVIMYDADHRKHVLLAICKWASNPELSFNFYDCARLSHEVMKP
jgi:trehalose utilization protein